jgi:aspartate aminotransferase-like enzyme
MKLFIPGPTHVRRSILEAQAAPMIGHRGEEMKKLLPRCLRASARASAPRATSSC